MKKPISFLLSIFTILFFTGCNLSPDKNESVYLFSCFSGDSRDGLHLLYSEDGYKWEALNGGNSLLTPMVGKDKLMRDPCIIEDEDGTFHMVWTVSWTEKGIGYAHSKDLVNWSEQQYIPVMEHEEGARNSWAPEITYAKDAKEFMIYWATTIRGKFPETQIEEDDGYNHRMYYTITKDFKSFSDTKLLYDAGFNVIDASIVPHNGEFIMFLKDETRIPPKKSLHVAKSTSLTGPYSQPSAAITGDYWAEEPTSLYIDGKWIVYFDKYRNRQMGAVESEDLINWTDITDSISFPAGTRHGSAIKVNKKILDNIRALTEENL
ncbi:MAG TPA: glycoside hydrolase family 43 protein [Marinilabiliaceae bacterium]|nr:glycoside hydrolase family 43 protein [Marinilabiliaceae bacterium]